VEDGPVDVTQPESAMFFGHECAHIAEGFEIFEKTESLLFCHGAFPVQFVRFGCDLVSEIPSDRFLKHLLFFCQIEIHGLISLGPSYPIPFPTPSQIHR